MCLSVCLCVCVYVFMFVQRGDIAQQISSVFLSSSSVTVRRHSLAPHNVLPVFDPSVPSVKSENDKVKDVRYTTDLMEDDEISCKNLKEP